MATQTRDRPSRFILKFLEQGVRVSSREIYEALEKQEPGRFTIQQIYRSVNSMTRSGRLKRDGRKYYIEGAAPSAPTPAQLLTTVPAVEGNTGLQLSLAKLKRWFFDHPDQEYHDSILLHKLELTETRLLEGLKYLVEEGTVEASTESDFLGTAYRLSPKAQVLLSTLPETPSTGLDSLELKARLEGIKRTLFNISKDLGRLEGLVRSEIEGDGN